MNDWVDADCIFTVAKSLKNGLVLYKDIFDHKGPIIYFIFYVSALISENSFIGLWLWEIIFVKGIGILSI